MHNVYRLPDLKYHGDPQPTTELDVVIATRKLVERIAAIPLEDDLPAKMLCKAGLLGLSVSDDLGGPDIANAVLAEAVSLLASRDLALAQALAGHFQVVEIVRSSQSARQSADFQLLALAGDFFKLLGDLDHASGQHLSWPRLAVAKGGVLVDTAGLASKLSAEEWIAIPSLDPEGQPVIALVEPGRGEPLLGNLANRGADRTTTLIFIPSSHIFAIPKGSASSVGILRNLLGASIDLGVSRSIFDKVGHEGLLQSPGEHFDSKINPERLRLFGRLAALLDGVSALIERAGQHLDMVQVDPSAELATQASVSAQGAAVLAADLLQDLNQALNDIQRSNLQTRIYPDRNEALQNPLVGPAGSFEQERLGAMHLRSAIPQNWPFAY